MSASFHFVAAGVILGLAALLVLMPRGLFAEAGDVRPSRRLEIALATGLAATGAAVVYAGGDADPWRRIALAAAVMTLAGVVYADLRFFIIPDLYSAVLGLLALFGPISLGVRPALLGAVVCGGLLAAVALAWKRSTDVEGIGFGDIKLAAAIGGLLAIEHGLWAIAGSAVCAALIGYGLRALRRGKDDEPMMLPYGAALALAGGGLLVWSRL